VIKRGRDKKRKSERAGTKGGGTGRERETRPLPNDNSGYATAPTTEKWPG